MQAERIKEHYSEMEIGSKITFAFFLVLQLKKNKSKYSFILDIACVLV